MFGPICILPPNSLNVESITVKEIGELIAFTSLFRSVASIPHSNSTWLNEIPLKSDTMYENKFFLVFYNFEIISKFGNFKVILGNLTMLCNFTIFGQFELE